MNAMVDLKNLLLSNPLRHLLIHGPRWRFTSPVGGVDIGFWQGLAPKDICAQMMGGGSDLWEINDTECSLAIARSVHSMEVLVYALLYVIALVKCYRLLNSTVHNTMAAIATPRITQNKKGGCEDEIEGGRAIEMSEEERRPLELKL